MPPSFSARRTRALMYNEGGTWAWNWGVINNILLFSMCARGGGGSQDFMVPEGWSTVGPGTGQLPGIYDLIQTDGSPPMPFMAILKTKAKRGIGSGAGLGRTTNATGGGVWTSGADGLLSIYSSHSAGDGAADAARWDAYSKADNKDSGGGQAAGLEGEVDSQDGQLAIVFRGTNSGPEWMLGEWMGSGGCAAVRSAVGGTWVGQQGLLVLHSVALRCA